MSQIYFIRHGKTPFNSTQKGEEVIRSWANPPLDTEGIKETKNLAKRLKKLSLPIKHLYSSDLDRAVQTAEIIGKELDLTYTSTYYLRPWHLGEYIAKPVDKNIEVLEYYERHPEKKVPGGESYNQFLKRLSHAVEFMREYADRNPEYVLAAITHSQDFIALPYVLSKGKKPIDPDLAGNTSQILRVIFNGEGYNMEHL